MTQHINRWLFETIEDANDDIISVGDHVLVTFPNTAQARGVIVATNPVDQIALVEYECRGGWANTFWATPFQLQKLTANTAAAVFAA